MENTTGSDADGETFMSPSQFWEKAVGDGEAKEEWYKGAVAYWDTQESSDNGVLGGYGSLSGTDIKGSRQFLRMIAKVNSRFKDIMSGNANDEARAFDGGAGIGRITEKLLLPLFSRVDLVEPCQKFIEVAKERLKPKGLRSPHENVVDQFYCVGIQDFHPKPRTYDLAWLQWCLMYLTDEDVADFLQTCKACLKPGGVAVVKENVARDGFVVDREDNSISRTSEYIKDLFAKGGFKLIAEMTQSQWPKDLFMVKMFAFAP